jgi:hypothetical protein
LVSAGYILDREAWTPNTHSHQFQWLIASVPGYEERSLRNVGLTLRTCPNYDTAFTSRPNLTANERIPYRPTALQTSSLQSTQSMVTSDVRWKIFHRKLSRTENFPFLKIIT